MAFAEANPAAAWKSERSKSPRPQARCLFVARSLRVVFQGRGYGLHGSNAQLPARLCNVGSVEQAPLPASVPVPRSSLLVRWAAAEAGRNAGYGPRLMLQGPPGKDGVPQVLRREQSRERKCRNVRRVCLPEAPRAQCTRACRPELRSSESRLHLL